MSSPIRIHPELESLAVPVSSLNLDPANARRHDQRNLAAIRASMEKFGQRQPIVVQREGMVVRAGNGRLVAARQMEWETIAAIVVDEGDVEATAYAIADNRTGELAEWDEEALAQLLGSMDDATLSVTGFNSKELDELARGMGGGDVEQDEVPDPPAEAVTKPGDVWTLGRHRVLCGDTSRIEDVRQVVSGVSVSLVMSDPPYNVKYTGGSTNEKERADSYADDMTDDDYTAWLRCAWHAAFEVATVDAALMIWFADRKIRCVLDAFEGAGWVARTMIIWNKLKAHYGALGAQYKIRMEPLWYCHKKGKAPQFFGATNECTVWDVDQPRVNELHPTMKPVELYARCVRNHSRKDQAVLECFLGSGTTLIAAEQLDRTCYGIEIEPRYVDVVVERWQNLTGEKAVRAGRGGRATRGKAGKSGPAKKSRKGTGKGKTGKESVAT